MADPKKSYNDIITWATGTSNNIIAKQLATARTISITNNSGTALASGTFNGTGNLTLKLPATVGIDISGNAATATKLGTANKGSATQPIYLNAGVPTAVGSSLAVSVTGNAATATKLKTARNIALTGAVTGNGNFDGSGNLSIVTTIMQSMINAGVFPVTDSASWWVAGMAYVKFVEIDFPSADNFKLKFMVPTIQEVPYSSGGTLYTTPAPTYYDYTFHTPFTKRAVAIRFGRDLFGAPGFFEFAVESVIATGFDETYGAIYINHKLGRNQTVSTTSNHYQSDGVQHSTTYNGKTTYYDIDPYVSLTKASNLSLDGEYFGIFYGF